MEIPGVPYGFLAIDSVEHTLVSTLRIDQTLFLQESAQFFGIGAVRKFLAAAVGVNDGNGESFAALAQLGLDGKVDACKNSDHSD